VGLFLSQKTWRGTLDIIQGGAEFFTLANDDEIMKGKFAYHGGGAAPGEKWEGIGGNRVIEEGGAVSHPKLGIWGKKVSRRRATMGT